jgi:hypothetical protein
MTQSPLTDEVGILALPAGVESPNELGFLLSVRMKDLRTLPTVGSLYSACPVAVGAVLPRLGDFASFKFVESRPGPDGYLRLRYGLTVTGPDLGQVAVATTNEPPGEFYESLTRTTERVRLPIESGLPAVGATTSAQQQAALDALAARREVTTWAGAGQKPLVGAQWDDWSGQVPEVTRELVRHDEAVASPTSLSTYLHTEVNPRNAGWAEEVTRIDPLKLRHNQTVRGDAFDERTGTVLPFEERVVTAGTRGRGLDSAGYFEEVTPINKRWSLLRRKPGGSQVVRAWSGVRRAFRWPAILRALVFQPVLDNSGNILKVLWHTQMEDEYIGPCRNYIEQRWSPRPFQALVPDDFEATEVRWNLIFSAGVVPPCLHGNLVIEESTGTDHPIYAFAFNRIVVPRTRLLSWPASVLADVDVRPMGGGYLQTVERVYAPQR